MRPVRVTDFFLLYRWANDSETRINSIRREAIPLGAHLRWFARNLWSSHNALLLVEGPGRYFWARKPLFFCRFLSIGECTWEISLNSNPAFRGQGLSRSLLSSALNFFAASKTQPPILSATVRRENEQSLRMFRGLGFEEREGDDAFVRLERRY